MSDPGPVPIDDRDDRDAASQILAAVHPVCSHDLPNQMVSLHSLLHLVEMEEVDRLSTDGREYLTRLHHVAEKTATLVDFLKESVRLVTYVPKMGRVDLRELIEELRLESRTFLDSTPAWSAELGAASVPSEEASLLRALTELVKGLAGSEKVAALRWFGRDDGNGVVLDLALRFAAPMANPTTEPRLDFVLAKSRLQSLRISVAPLTASPDTVGVRLRFPTEAS